MGGEALYPGATRGRHRNTVFVVTQTAPAGTDAETGDTAKALRKDPRAVLGQILENARRDQTATTLAAESAAEMANVRTPAELFAAAASDVATARTAGWLDDLTAAGVLTDAQREQLAAEDAAASLGRMLRRVELAGHDPRHVLIEAITSRELDGARQLTNVLHDRIARTWDLDPTGDTYTSWTPSTERQDWRDYLDALAAAADRRRDELGAALVVEPPAWALEALGPVPEDLAARREWQDRAGRVAAHRELTGHDDPDTAIGPAPAPGMVEAHASWRAAWRALGRPDTDRDEASMSDGQLRMRILAYQREQAWAPRNVTNELAGTIQAADHHRSLATRRAAEAETTTDHGCAKKPPTPPRWSTPSNTASTSSARWTTIVVVDSLAGPVTGCPRLSGGSLAWWRCAGTAGCRRDPVPEEECKPSRRGQTGNPCGRRPFLVAVSRWSSAESAGPSLRRQRQIRSEGRPCRPGTRLRPVPARC